MQHTHHEPHEHPPASNHEHLHASSHSPDNPPPRTSNHSHTHENSKAVINRLSRAIGHLESVKKMVQDGRDCSEVLMQIAAVRSAINNVGKVILQDHLRHCIVEAVDENDEDAIDQLCEAIDKFVK